MAGTPAAHPRKVMATMSRAEELRAELARIENNEAVTGDVVTEPSNGLELVIKGEAFACRRVSTSWQMMQFAKAQREASITVPKNMPEGPQRTKLEERRNNAGMAMMALLLDTAMILLQPHERDRFRAFMDEISYSDEGLDQGELENAIGNVIAAAGGESGKAERPTASHSSASPTKDKESIQVISLDKGTVEIVPQELTSSTV